MFFTPALLLTRNFGTDKCTTISTAHTTFDALTFNDSILPQSLPQSAIRDDVIFMSRRRRGAGLYVSRPCYCCLQWRTGLVRRVQCRSLNAIVAQHNNYPFGGSTIDLINITTSDNNDI
jgi:hypothetical protein